MLHFLKDTWLPAVVFGGLAGLAAMSNRDNGTTCWGPALAALIVPLTWKSFVIRQGRPRIRRAALAGSAATFMMAWSDAMIDSTRTLLHSRGQASEGLAGLLVILIPPLMLLTFLLGAGVASLVALVQARMWPSTPLACGTAAPALDGAVGGALVATLAAPFVAPFAAIPLAPFLAAQAPGMNFMTLTAATWLVLAVAGAWLGVKAVRRWRRIKTAAEAPA